MNRLTRAAAFAAAALFCSCPLTREKPDPVEIRVQNSSPYDVFLRGAPDRAAEPLLLLQSVDSLESSIRTFRYQPASTDDRLTFYPFFLLPVASVLHPTLLDSMVVYYEEFFVTDIYLTVRLSEQKKEYTANVNQWPRSVSYQKAYVEVENAGGAACEVLRGASLCSKSDFFVRGIGSINEETVADGETAVFAFDPGFGIELTFRFLSGSAGDRSVSVPALDRGEIVRIRLLPTGEVEISEVEAVTERQ